MHKYKHSRAVGAAMPRGGGELKPPRATAVLRVGHADIIKHKWVGAEAPRDAFRRPRVVKVSSGANNNLMKI